MLTAYMEIFSETLMMLAVKEMEIQPPYRALCACTKMENSHIRIVGVRTYMKM